MGETFIDYYELLQLSPNADEDTIHRVFRHAGGDGHVGNTGNAGGGGATLR